MLNRILKAGLLRALSVLNGKKERLSADDVTKFFDSFAIKD